MRWLKDPVTNQPSVALTLLIVAVVFMVLGVIMEAFTPLRSSHLLDELFGAAMTLYGTHAVMIKPEGRQDASSTDVRRVDAPRQGD